MPNDSALVELLRSTEAITPGQREILARGALSTAMEALAQKDIPAAKAFIVEAYHQLLLRGDGR